MPPAKLNYNIPPANSSPALREDTIVSGMRLNSFKASTLLKDNADIMKCLFVVERRDLNRQTHKEFNRFQVGCVEENTHIAASCERLRDNYHRHGSGNIRLFYSSRS